jgi:membrane associated rhomboid family serine protease
MCEGMWLPAENMKAYVLFLKDDPTTPESEITYQRAVVNPYVAGENEKKCPNCTSAMKHRNYAYDSNIFVNYCDSCDAYWLDKDEPIKIASHLKGNTVMKEVGNAFGKEEKEREELVQNMSNLQSSVSAWGIFYNLIPMPIGDTDDKKSFPIVVTALIVLNIAIFLFTQHDLLITKEAIHAFAFNPAQFIPSRKFYTLLTAFFIHGSIFHIGFNMLYLWIFGDNIERRIGSIGFFLYYLLLGLVTSFLALFIYHNRDVPKLGASGAIAGIMGAYLVLSSHTKIKLIWLGTTVRISAYAFLVFWLLQQVLDSLLSDSTTNVGWSIHIVGFILGVGSAYIIKKAKGEAHS